MAAMASLPVISGTFFIPLSPVRITSLLPVVKQDRTRAWKSRAFEWEPV